MARNFFGEINQFIRLVTTRTHNDDDNVWVVVLVSWDPYRIYS